MRLLICFAVIISMACRPSQKKSSSSQEIYQFPSGFSTHWSSFENPSAEKGKGGLDNKGAKGHAFERLEAGETKTLLDIQGSGVIRRMWITIMQKDPVTLRSLKLEMYWDGMDTPAVSVPFGDFFGSILGRNQAFENAFFSNPEGRSYNFVIPMPFRKGARILLINEADYQISHVFYDINFTRESITEDALYFHSWWMHENPTTLGKDFTVLPKISGKGKYLGAHIGIIDVPMYRRNWWGEGEIKIYLEGDTDLPTLVGTGTEDYIGTGWGQGSFFNRFQGCSIAKWPYFGFYRYHIPDPVVFNQDIRVTLQVIGGTSDREQLIEMSREGVPMTPISIDAYDGPVFKDFLRLLDMDTVPAIDDHSLPHGHMNYYRIADMCAVVFFYLDKPVSGLEAIEDVQKRISNIQ